MADPARGVLRRAPSVLRAFLEREAAGGLVLMAAAALAFLLANSPVAGAYERLLHLPLGPLALQHWINDGLMAVFFLLVGLEIKRELLDGHLASWPRRLLPGLAAAGGMAMPALIYAALNWHHPERLAGWAIPSATDIAFALGVIRLLGKRVPASLAVFLAALAILDDLGAVAIIALFYGDALSPPHLGLAFLVLGCAVLLGRRGVTALWPYLLLGLLLWLLVMQSGVHATLAGVALALAIPLRADPGRPDDLASSPLHRLEMRLYAPVAFAILPLFALANAGLSLSGIGADRLLDGVTLGVTLGLVLGKPIGVCGAAWLAIRLRWARLPLGASWAQFVGVGFLCGIGFTMSLFIGMLAFAQRPILAEETKLGIVMGSLIAGVIGWGLLRAIPGRFRRPGGASTEPRQPFREFTATEQPRQR